MSNLPPENRLYHCLEFSTVMGCVNKCWYCPQKLILSKYKGKMKMTLEDYKLILSHTPNTVRLRYAGFAEQFQNPEFSDMLVYANEKGYKQAVYTTLKCFRDSDYEKIKDIPFEFFHVHDIGQERKDYPFIDEWKKVTPNNRANNLETEELPPVPRKEYVSRCTHTEGFHLNTVMPNGDVVLCCSDWGLDNIIGNLYEQNYYDLKRPDHPNNVEICHTCVYSS